jgi:hypothetical protein
VPFPTLAEMEFCGGLSSHAAITQFSEIANVAFERARLQPCHQATPYDRLQPLRRGAREATVPQALKRGTYNGDRHEWNSCPSRHQPNNPRPSAPKAGRAGHSDGMAEAMPFQSNNAIADFGKAWLKPCRQTQFSEIAHVGFVEGHGFSRAIKPRQTTGFSR